MVDSSSDTLVLHAVHSQLEFNIRFVSSDLPRTRRKIHSILHLEGLDSKHARLDRRSSPHILFGRADHPDHLSVSETILRETRQPTELVRARRFCEFRLFQVGIRDHLSERSRPRSDRCDHTQCFNFHESRERRGDHGVLRVFERTLARFDGPVHPCEDGRSDAKTRRRVDRVQLLRERGVLQDSPLAL